MPDRETAAAKAWEKASADKHPGALWRGPFYKDGFFAGFDAVQAEVERLTRERDEAIRERDGLSIGIEEFDRDRLAAEADAASLRTVLTKTAARIERLRDNDVLPISPAVKGHLSLIANAVAAALADTGQADGGGNDAESRG